MRKIISVLTCGLLLWSLCAHAAAIGSNVSDIASAQKEAYGVSELESALPEEAYSAWGNITVEDASHPQSLLEQLWETISGSSNELVTSAMQNAAMILLLCFVISVVQTLPLDGGQANVCGIVGAVSIALICTREATACVPLGFHVMESLSSFSGRLLPALCAAATAGGALTSAGAKYAVSSLFLDLFITIMTQYLRPMLDLYIAAVIAGNVLQNEILLSVTSLFKRVLRVCLIGSAAAFTGYLTLTGVLSGSVDAAAAKAAKTTVSTVLPVVGGILSDAAGTIISGAGILRSGIGSLGLLCVLAVSVIPYASLGIHYLMYQLISGFTSSFSDKRISALLHGFSDVYAMLLGVVGTISFVMFASIVSLMRAVSG